MKDPFTRAPDECLSDWLSRLYDSRTEEDWAHLDRKVREASELRLPVPPMAETLWTLRQMELADTPSRDSPALHGV